MGKEYQELDADLTAFIKAQHMFFVASAPLAGGGHINVSPKGLEGSFVILSGREVAYLDLPGSGIETVAHIRENARITIMFCAFEGAPNIVRLYGKGTVIWPENKDFKTLAGHFVNGGSARSIIRVSLTRITDSCGYGVPLYSHVRQRTTLTRWTASQTPEELRGYIKNNNARSIDGLAGAEE